MLTEQQVAQYHRDGFVIPDYRLPMTTLQEIRADYDRLLQKHPEFRDFCPALLAYDVGFLNYARNPAILDMVEQTLGPDFALWNSSFFAKPAAGGKRTPWHQDGEYWPIRPIATCSVWMAIDDASPENGCLRFLRGSHRDKRLWTHRTVDSSDVTLSQEIPPTEYDETEAVDVVLEAGQISLHDVFLVHGSAANHSGRPRRGMTLRFMPTTSVFDRELSRSQHANVGIANHSERTLFLMRGSDRCGRNDFVVRR